MPSLLRHSVRKLLLFVSLFICFSHIGLAQATSSITLPHPKCGLEVNKFLRSYKENKASALTKAYDSKTSPSTVSLVLRSSDTLATRKALQQMGCSYHHIYGQTFTVSLSPDSIENLANRPSILSITGLQKRNLHLDAARTASFVNEVHSGTDLETPFTGKGVVIGIIDQGFQYTHPAFLITQDSTRIVSFWNTSQPSPTFGSANILAKDNDGFPTSHATHVSGIAAGGNVLGSKTFYGMAPEAHLVAVSSESLDDADILNGINLVKDVASQLQEPWVINMSFGSNFGPHDGSEELCLTLDSLCNNGGHFVCSSGNNGNENLHASFDFTTTHDTCYMVIQHNLSEIDFYITSDDTTSLALDVPLVYNTITQQFSEVNRTAWNNLQRNISSGISQANHRFYYSAELPLTTLFTGYTNLSSLRLYFRIKGAAGHHFDAFLETDGAVFTNAVNDMVCTTADNAYSVNMPATSRKTVAVGAYNTKNSFVNLNNATLNMAIGTIGNLAGASSIGPTTDSTLYKPDICAPGYTIISSVKKQNSEYSNSNSLLAEKITLNGVSYYYGALQGTSMACPAVTGVIALWLQANPTLTQDQVMEVLRKSSTTDTYTGNTWNSKWGFGKINAYEGLKEILRSTDVQSVQNSAQPVSIQKSDAQWKILFNNDETFANIAVYSMAGTTIRQTRLSNVCAGEEQVLSFNDLLPGIYTVRIVTENSCTARKFIIR